MKIHCPCCKSDYTATATKTDHNGILGPGSRSWIKERKCFCLECGVMFLSPEQLEQIRENHPKPNAEPTVQECDASKAP